MAGRPYTLYFVNRRSGVQQDDPFGSSTTLIRARKLAVDILKKSNHTAAAIYRDNGIGMEIYVGKVQYDGDGHFFYSYSGKKWRIHTDGKIVKLKNKAAPFGL